LSLLLLDRAQLEVKAEGETLALYEAGVRRGTVPIKLIDRCVIHGAQTRLDSGVLMKLAEAGVTTVLMSPRSPRRVALVLGSQHNDAFLPSEDDRLRTATNNSGGIQGGISNGEPITLRVAFKPTATIRKEQQTINAAGEAITLAAKGRHDPCVLPRAVPMVEAMVALVLADHLLRQQGQCSLF